MKQYKRVQSDIIITHIFRIQMSNLIFQSISWQGNDAPNEDYDNTDIENSHETVYIIKVFGMTLEGTTVSVSIKNFKPYFFIKVGNSADANYVKNALKNKDDDLLKGVYNVSEIESKDFWGFTNKNKFKFLKISFHDYGTMRNYIRTFTKGKKCMKCYEYNIDPYIRFMHKNNIVPCGWLEIKKGLYEATDILPSTSSIDVECSFKNIKKYECDDSAPFLVASFDLECMSLTGDFPLPVKDYKKLSSEIHDLYFSVLEIKPVPERVYLIQEAIIYSLGLCEEYKYSSYVHRVQPKKKIGDIAARELVRNIKMNAENILMYINKQYDCVTKNKRDSIIDAIIVTFTEMKFPPLQGDEIIQIGTTFHRYGQKYNSEGGDANIEKYVYTLGSCDNIDGAIVVAFTDEKDMILAWKNMIIEKNPEIITGYNILGFDFWYLYERAKELKIDTQLLRLGRLKGEECKYVEKTLASSALGDNILKYIDMSGRVIIDVMKVVQRDHKLDSYKLDNVAEHFIGMKKDDVTPQDIFRLQRGDSVDRAIIAKYCIKDCSLCNNIIMKLEIIANNMGMSNVCLVPLSFIFMRGQGIKIFSLILKECSDAGYKIPVLNYNQNAIDQDVGYEGAIVLDPKEGVYIDDPVTVLDYASLYPSSMISENLSHDCIVLDKKYDNLPGVEYNDISYDIYEGLGDKKTKVGVNTCRFVQNDVGVIPNILIKLLNARKSTRKLIGLQTIEKSTGETFNGFLNKEKTKITTEDGAEIEFDNKVDKLSDFYNEFQKSVLDGMQNAYKITANSLYGQMGARTSQVYMKDIAACTTATGRKMILLAKDYLEKEFNANIVYGDTDSIFCIFPNSEGLKGKDKIIPSIKMGTAASIGIKSLLKKPHDLEYEKTFWPFILLSKKRYVGNLYTYDDKSYKQSSMGIVLKRRDNAQIVKYIYGGIIDIILNRHDVDESVKFLNKSLRDLVDGKIEIDQLIVTKRLRSQYADPTKIAHKVLADRIKDRDPGNAPQSNDRIPYAYIVKAGGNKKCLQGERIEHPDFINKHKLKLDYNFYITNQIMKPVLQVYGIIASQLEGNNCDYDKIYEKLKLSLDEKDAKDKLMEIRETDAKTLLFDPILRKLTNTNNNQKEITSFFKSNVIDKNSIKAGDDLDIKVLNTIKRKKKEKDEKEIKKKNPISKFLVVDKK